MSLHFYRTKLSKRGFLGIFLFLWIAFQINAQNDLKVFENQINKENIKSYIQTLTTDSMCGRDVALGGEKKAGNFIAGFFADNSLNKCGTDNYHQCFSIQDYIYSCKASLNNKAVEDFVFLGKDTTTVWHTLPVFFAGYQQTLPDSIENHAIIVFAMDISDMMEAVVKLRENHKNNVFLLFFGDDGYTFDYISASYKSYINKTFNKKTNLFHTYFNLILAHDPDLKLFFFDDAVFKKFTEKGIRKAKKESRTALMMKKSQENIISNMDLKYRTQTEVKKQTSCNIIGMIEGTTKKDEYLIVTAHYDHLGKNSDGEIYRGADDNASGTAALMSVAESFASASQQGIRPKRSIVFITFGSEESGLLGSNFYVNNPVFPLEKTVAVINMDMIGRGEKYSKNDDFVFIECYGKKSDDLKDYIQNIDNELDIKIKKAPALQKMIYRFASDHYNFVQKEIPAIVLFTGTHDDYHTPNDTLEKLNYDNMEKISKLVFRLISEISN